MIAQLPHVVIHTDGACSGNPGPGGWGAILRYGDREKELNGGEALTTNNRMELMAASRARSAQAAVQRRSSHRQPVRAQRHHGVDGGWKRNGWRTADKKPVKNVDLWQRLEAALAPHQVRWHWVRGHAGHVMNERADVLAREAIAEIRNAGGDAVQGR